MLNNISTNSVKNPFLSFLKNCPLGVKGRNSDNKLYREKIGWEVNQPLIFGLQKTYTWIKLQVEKKEEETKWIYESPDGETIFRRESGDDKKEKIK